jgi:aspartyl-tRNA(Asn)/glutamyl-tRNA(Gln) amidotransferase subunit C
MCSAILLKPMMTTTEDELKKVAALAYLEMDKGLLEKLTHDVGAIMNFVTQLRQIDTKSITPLSHPIDLDQHLREDEINTENCVEQLEKIAPLFMDNLYLVPKAISTEK